VPTILTHAALPLIAGWGLGGKCGISARLAVAGSIVAILPDLDVSGFRMGIAYGDPLGHRGISHSLAVAILTGLIASFFWKSLRSGRATAFAFLTLSAASHGLTDMLTDGGKGIAILWPLDENRYFAPIRPIRVSSFGFDGLRSGSFWPTLESEFIWLIIPALLLALLYRLWLHPHIDLTKGQI
jgi:inner membrane protein